MANRLQSLWRNIIALIKSKNTFDIGTMQRICATCEDDESLTSAIISNSIIDFVVGISQYVRNNPTSNGQRIAIIVIQSIIYNMYFKKDNQQQFFRGNTNTFSFYHSMQMSQLSLDQYSQASMILNQDNTSKITSILESLLASDKFFLKLKVISQRKIQGDYNHKYIEILFSTIEHIFKQQKISTQTLKIRRKSLKSIKHLKRKINSSTVNNIIFSNKLDRIVTLLTPATEDTYFALIRIYEATKMTKEHQQLQQVAYSGQQMLLNLQKYYVESFSCKLETFEESKNPLFVLEKAYLVCHFLPIAKVFSEIVTKYAKLQFNSISSFYQTNQMNLGNDISQFIDNLPIRLLNHLHQLYLQLQRIFPNDPISSTIPVKRLLLYSFLLSPQLSVEFIQDFDTNYGNTCNYILNIFFEGSTQKIVGASQSQLDPMKRLTTSISKHLDEKIKCFHKSIEEINQSHYLIEKPILSFDYTIMTELALIVEFTPKDSRQFTMIKHIEACNKNLDSPTHIREQTELISLKQLSSEIQENEEKADLIAWMAVGGTHNYNRPKQSPSLHPKIEMKLPMLPFELVKTSKEKFQRFASMYVD